MSETLEKTSKKDKEITSTESAPVDQEKITTLQNKILNKEFIIRKDQIAQKILKLEEEIFKKAE